MPVKHGPKNVRGKITVDKRCIEPECTRDATPGKLMCRDHEPKINVESLLKDPDRNASEESRHDEGGNDPEQDTDPFARAA